MWNYEAPENRKRPQWVSSNMCKRALIRFSGYLVVTNTKCPTRIDIFRQLPSATTPVAKSWEWKRKNAASILNEGRNILKQGQRREVKPLESDSVISYPISDPLESIVFTSERVNGHFARNKTKWYWTLNAQTIDNGGAGLRENLFLN